MPNRRKRKPQYLLDVAIPRTGLGSRGVHVASGPIVLVLLLVVAGYALYRGGHWMVDRFVYQNNRYTIREIVVENDGVLDREVITQFIAAREGANLLAFDLDLARRNLELIPLVRRAEVRRVLPSRLVIQVEERRPVARLQVRRPELRNAEFLIDRSGTVFKSLELSDGRVIHPQLSGTIPVLTNVSPTDIQVGRKATSPSIYQALEWLDEFQQSAAASMAEVVAVELSHPRRLVAHTRSGTAVTFETQDYVQQIRRLGVILWWAGREQRQPATVNLAVGQSVPVTWR